MRQCRVVAMVGALLASGCSMPSVTTSQSLPFLPMAIPVQPSANHEIALMRVDHLLQHQELSKSEQAQLFFERGLINDSLGLRNIAQIDFERSLLFNPIQPEIYNLMGVFFTQEQKYDFAYDAFDSALELDEEHQHALFNRGIALYYAGRYHLAVRDLFTHYQSNINDPYSAVWLYFAELEQLGAQKARANLAIRYQDSDQSALAWDIARLLLNQVSEQQFLRELQLNSFDNAELAEKLCEGYFYLAKHYQQHGHQNLAITAYKLAMASNAYALLEHRFTLLELNKIAKKQQNHAEDQTEQLAE